MCGIAGFLHLGGDPAGHAAVLDAMLGAIRHRGPDDSGTWLLPERGLGLGMRRLSIVDLAGGHQPIWNEDGSIGVVFNGEIYNHADLRATLTARGHRFATRSDTEVLVHLYEEFGAPGMLESLRGMFAFALIDRPRGHLVLARDPFGMKPLYYAPAAGGIAFASEAKALRAAGVTLALDADRYLDYVNWLSLPAPHTHWKDVKKFRPGEWQQWDIATGAQLHRGCARVPRFASRGSFATLDDASAALDRALEDSVRRHLQADVPVGLLLSGGLDSRTIGFYAGRDHSRGLHTFTAGTSGEGSEFAAARETARALNSTHHEILISGEDFSTTLDRLAWHLDEPIGDPAAFALWQLCAAARGHVKVLLSGEGSDELFAGYAERYGGMVSTAHRSILLRRWLGWTKRPAARAAGKWGRWRERAHLSPGAELIGLRIEGVGRRAPDLLSGPQAEELNRRRDFWAENLDFQHRDTLSACQQLDLAWQLPESLLMKADKMSMAASIELRCPFLDHAVADVAMQIPPRLRLQGAVGKLAVRRTVARHLTEESVRPKLGFVLPLGRWLRDPLRKMVEATLLDRSSAATQFFGQPALERFWRGFVAKAHGGAHLLYSLWLYERWRAAQLAGPC